MISKKLKIKKIIQRAGGRKSRSSRLSIKNNRNIYSIINTYKNNKLDDNNIEIIKTAARTHKLNLSNNRRLYSKTSLTKEEANSINGYKNKGKYKTINDELWKYSGDNSFNLSSETSILLNLIIKTGINSQKNFTVYRSMTFTEKIDNPIIAEYIKKLQTLEIDHSIDYNALLSSSLSRPIEGSTNIIKINIPANTKFLFLSKCQREILLLPCTLVKRSIDYIDDKGNKILGIFDLAESENINIKSLITRISQGHKI